MYWDCSSSRSFFHLDMGAMLADDFPSEFPEPAHGFFP